MYNIIMCLMCFVVPTCTCTCTCRCSYSTCTCILIILLSLQIYRTVEALAVAPLLAMVHSYNVDTLLHENSAHPWTHVGSART